MSSAMERIRKNDSNRSWPTWTTGQEQSEDAIVSAITELFWSSASETINMALLLSLEIAKRSGIKLTALSKDNVTSQPPDSKPFDPSQEEKAFRHIACCLLQTIGLFDCSVLLEHRGDTLGTGIKALDWIFSHPNLRFVTRNTLHLAALGKCARIDPLWSLAIRNGRQNG
ncbi:hypothetical protein EW146_g2728 [Bondarzewia mesenterica]|uniref:Uncharacterized protein n=1 Tax=Bondarzewia mesenterica TaxID=1095465 RepID=A0A4V3XFN5_9AGAM|nr:hypothetical protein EW146_g2728 [Bondarzewia mesenterica]